MLATRVAPFFASAESMSDMGMFQQLRSSRSPGNFSKDLVYPIAHLHVVAKTLIAPPASPFSISLSFTLPLQSSGSSMSDFLSGTPQKPPAFSMFCQFFLKKFFAKH